MTTELNPRAQILRNIADRCWRQLLAEYPNSEDYS